MRGNKAISSYAEQKKKNFSYHSPLERKVSPSGFTKVKVSTITADIRIICHSNVNASQNKTNQ
jgi:hypothetical protein